jgi:hypothetical protein
MESIDRYQIEIESYSSFEVGTVIPKKKFELIVKPEAYKVLDSRGQEVNLFEIRNFTLLLEDEERKLEAFETTGFEMFRSHGGQPLLCEDSLSSRTVQKRNAPDQSPGLRVSDPVVAEKIRQGMSRIQLKSLVVAQENSQESVVPLRQIQENPGQNSMSTAKNIQELKSEIPEGPPVPSTSCRRRARRPAKSNEKLGEQNAEIQEPEKGAAEKPATVPRIKRILTRRSRAVQNLNKLEDYEVPVPVVKRGRKPRAKNVPKLSPKKQQSDDSDADFDVMPSVPVRDKTRTKKAERTKADGKRNFPYSDLSDWNQSDDDAGSKRSKVSYRRQSVEKVEYQVEKSNQSVKILPKMQGNLIQCGNIMGVPGDPNKLTQGPQKTAHDKEMEQIFEITDSRGNVETNPPENEDIQEVQLCCSDLSELGDLESAFQIIEPNHEDEEEALLNLTVEEAEDFQSSNTSSKSISLNGKFEFESVTFKLTHFVFHDMQ